MDRQTPDLQAVVERLETVERQNRRLKRRGLVMLAAVGALALAGFVMAAVALAQGGAASIRLVEDKPVSDEDVEATDIGIVRAYAFQVVDRKGKVLASLNEFGLRLEDSLGGEAAAGSVVLSPFTGLSFNYPEGEGNIRLSRLGLQFHYSQGKESIDLSPFVGLRFLVPDGTVRLACSYEGLMLADSKGVQRAVLTIDEKKNGPFLSLDREGGKGSMQITDSKLGLFHTDGKSRILMVVGDDGAPALTLFGESPTEGIGIAIDNEGDPRVSLCDSSGKTRAELGCTKLVVKRTGETRKTAPSTLTLFDKEGDVIWQAPPR